MKKVLLLASFLTTLGAAGVSFAGYRAIQVPWIVKNADGSGRFNGALTSAYRSADSLAYVGCYVYATSVSCFVRDPSGVAGSCSTTNSGLMNAARSIDGTSSLYVTYDTSATCTSIQVTKASYNL